MYLYSNIIKLIYLLWLCEEALHKFFFLLMRCWTCKWCQVTWTCKDCSTGAIILDSVIGYLIFGCWTVYVTDGFWGHLKNKQMYFYRWCATCLYFHCHLFTHVPGSLLYIFCFGLQHPSFQNYNNFIQIISPFLYKRFLVEETEALHSVCDPFFELHNCVLLPNCWWLFMFARMSAVIIHHPAGVKEDLVVMATGCVHTAVSTAVNPCFPHPTRSTNGCLLNIRVPAVRVEIYLCVSHHSSWLRHLLDAHYLHHLQFIPHANGVKSAQSQGWDNKTLY